MNLKKKNKVRSIYFTHFIYLTHFIHFKKGVETRLSGSCRVA
jgi:hypothetical protein